MELKPGSRWASRVCDAEFVIVRPPKGGGVLACGGVEAAPHGGDRSGEKLTEAQGDGLLTGKRYHDVDTGCEVLCTKAGLGALSLDGRPLTLKEAKALPASD